MTAAPIFGFRPSVLDADAVCAWIGTTRPAGATTQSAGPRLVVTPNLDHVVQLRRHAEFRAAYRTAAIVLCDGFPVQYYARLRGHRVSRVTGCDVITRLLAPGAVSVWHRVMFVVDRPETARAVEHWSVQGWAAAQGMAGRVETVVPRNGFVNDANACRQLAAMIRQHAATIVIMGVGAPQSEIFIHRYRAELPDCWALCTGQAVKIALGLVRRAPRGAQTLHVEWLWRLIQEPRRLAWRYGWGAFAFVGALAEDLWRGAP